MTGSLEGAVKARSQRRGALILGLNASILSGALIQGGLGALLPYMGKDLPMTHTLESLHITGLAVGGLVASALAEIIRRRMGRGRLLVVGAVSCAVGASLLAVAPAPVVSAAAMLFVGFGLTSTLITGQVLVVALHGRQRGSRMIGEINVSYGIGAVVAALLLPLIAVSVFGWRGFAAIPAAMLVFLVVPLVLMGIRRTSTEGEVASAKDFPPASGRARFAPVVMVLSVVVEWGFLFWLATHLTTVAGLHTDEAARAVAAMWFAVLVGRIVGSRLLGAIPPRTLLAVSLVLAVAATFSLNAVTTPTGAIITGVVAGLAVANLYAGSIAFLIDADPARADRAVARGSLAAGAALIVAPLAMGMMADVIGLRIAFLLVGTIAVAGALVMLAVVRPHAPSDSVSAAPYIENAPQVFPAEPTLQISTPTPKQEEPPS